MRNCFKKTCLPSASILKKFRIKSNWPRNQLSAHPSGAFTKNLPNMGLTGWRGDSVFVTNSIGDAVKSQLQEAHYKYAFQKSRSQRFHNSLENRHIVPNGTHVFGGGDLSRNISSLTRLCSVLIGTECL